MAATTPIRATRGFGLRSTFSSTPTIHILNGTRFMVTSRTGDIHDVSHGLFREDTRFLSKYVVTVNGKPLDILSSENTTHYSAAFYLTNPAVAAVRRETGRPLPKIEKENLVIQRRRFIEKDVQEEVFVTNVTRKSIDFELSFQLEADFADIFDVKSAAFRGKPDVPRQDRRTRVGEHGNHSRHAARTGRGDAPIASFDRTDNAFNFEWSDTRTKFRAKTLVWFSQESGRTEVTPGRGAAAGGSMSYRLSLGPHETFHSKIVAVLLLDGEKRRARYTDEYFERQERKIERAVRHWNLSVPALTTDWDSLRHSYRQSLIDVVSLKMSDPAGKHRWQLPAAGCPWFMTLFGRDTLITSYESMLYGTDFAIGAIQALAEYQGTRVDDGRDEQPGKILHEIRFGDYAARSGMYPYYGTVDATELFLIVASEIYRWTGDSEFIGRHERSMRSALEWIDNYGDMDNDGFVEYIKRSPHGLDNQSWKDSWNAIQFADGSVARPPIATCEVQGYVYDAKMRFSEIAREVWRDGSLSKRLTDEARELKRKFNESFWLEDRGYYALALDKQKHRVDSMTSNNGQLLWSGIVDDDKVDAVVEKLLDRKTMFSGYGVRTMSAEDKGFDPIGYHTGCVWPHDNGLIATGLARYGRRREAMKITKGILSAAPDFGYTFPETFAGFSRLKTGFPVMYPTSCSPQAWAAGSVLLFLRTLLGISPTSDRKGLQANPLDGLADSGGANITLKGVRAFGRGFVVEVEDGAKPRVYEDGQSEQG